MFQDGQVCFVIENFIENVRGITYGRRNDFRAILRKLVTTPGVKRNALPIPKVARQGSGVTDFASHGKALPVRRRQGSATPMLRQGLPVLEIHQSGDGGFQRFLT